ncbi:MAG: histidine phosphatase family protein [Bacteroidota bacterium]
MSRLILIRHGQASFMSENYDQLSPKGKEQSRILGTYLANYEPNIDSIYVGPLHRHQQTLKEVEAAYKAANVPWAEPQLLAGLDEHHATEAMMEAMPYLQEHDPFVQKHMARIEEEPGMRQRLFFQVFKHFCRQWSQGNLEDHTGNIQSWAAFRSAVNQGLDQIIKENQQGKTVLAFTSGGTTAASMGYTLGLSHLDSMELNFIVQNTAMTELLFSRNNLSLMRFNHIPHLTQQELITFV